jgi:lysophospholipase L1-like esterase
MQRVTARPRNTGKADFRKSLVALNLARMVTAICMSRRDSSAPYRYARATSLYAAPFAQAFLLTALAGACTRHCVDDPARTAVVAPAGSVTAVPGVSPPSSLSRLQFVGRVAFTPSGQAQYAWPGTGFRVRFSGRGVSVKMDDSGRYHTVVVDGEFRPRLATQPGTQRYMLAGNLAPGEHVVELYRRTEALVGMTTVIAVEAIDGQVLEMPSRPERHIEVIGDSISCGYGIEGADTSCHFSPETENHSLTYGALLARHFGAQLSTIAWSGRGVVKNHSGEPGDFMPELYKRILPEHPEVTPGLRPPADLVIVNLGTNDFSTEPDPPDTTFVTAYVELLAEVRRQSPRAQILATIGPMLSGADLERAERAIRQAVEHRVRAGDSRVLYHKLRTANDKPGCDWHPNLRTHESMAKELEEPIARALKW